jgi:Flp pilus assembly protein CpaB
LQSAGGIQPGDQVDVFLFTADRDNLGGGESKLLISGVTVVGILNQNGQAISGKEGKTQGSATVPSVAQVLVTAAQANLLNAAANIGELSLARYLPQSQPVKDVPTFIVTGGSIQ